MFKGLVALLTCELHRVCGGMIKIVRESPLFILFEVRRTSEVFAVSPNPHNRLQLVTTGKTGFTGFSTHRFVTCSLFGPLFIEGRLFQPPVY